MSNICTPEEIAEKRRIAQERLKQKLATNSNTNRNCTPNINTPSKTTTSLPAKGTSNFYNKQSENFKISNGTVNNTTANNNPNSYKKFISSLPRQFTSNQIKENSETSLGGVKSIPIFPFRIKCELTIISETRFLAKPVKYHEQLITVFKTIPSKYYDSKTRLWNFNISDYDLLLQRVEDLKSQVEFDTIPKQILDLIRKPQDDVDFSYLPSIESKLVKSLMHFQKEGVCFGISKQGRVMIADEMGLGKTLQAIAIADYFKEDWPVLITTTASTRNSWFTHIKEYLPSIRYHDIVNLTSSDFYLGDAKIVITSYSLMERHVEKLLERKFGVLIFDESHSLKSFDAKRTINADKLAKNCRRIVLLSGTPALSKPVELFCQLKMIDRHFLPFKTFSQRYCDGKQTNFGWDSSGQSNLAELNVVLKKKFMIRRLKSDVLSELAEKNRETVKLNPELIKMSEEIRNDFTKYEKQLVQGSNSQAKEILLTFYAKTAEIKANAVCDYLKKLIKEDKKFIVFAHHKVMMNAISEFLYKKKVDFIRIDGTTRSDLRDEYVKKFQSKSSCKIALLSLHACNAGITLTAADLVVFAELDWNPSTLAQAESRAHRIGQQNSVTCRYLLADNTADTVIWQMLKDKQDVLKDAGLFSENLQNAVHFNAPTSSQAIDKYFTPTKRKIEHFYSTSKSDNSEIDSNDSKIKKFKIQDNLNTSTTAQSIVLPENKNCLKKENINENKNKSNEYDSLFNELDDADIPPTPAVIPEKTNNVKSDFDDFFNDIGDDVLANINI